MEQKKRKRKRPRLAAKKVKNIVFVFFPWLEGGKSDTRRTEEREKGWKIRKKKENHLRVGEKCVTSAQAQKAVSRLKEKVKKPGTEAGGALDLIKRESIFFFPRHFLRRADIHGEGIGTRAVTSPSGLFPLTVTLWFRFQNSQESRCKYWANRSSVCSFARTAHSFANSAELALLAHSQTRGTVNH